MDQLTTPVLRDNDAVTPAENWFLYWKTSPSLWESKLSEYQGISPIFVPIYWALHSEYTDHYDFGQSKPTTDLKRLEEIALKLGKSLVFLMPVTPSPFLTNGGIPSYLARNMALNKEGLAIAAIDNLDNVNRIYSYFEPKVFQAFRKFCHQVGHYFSQSGIESQIFGLNSYRIEDGHIVSFFKDHSSTFDTGYNRYIKQLQDSEPEKVQELITNPSLENNLKLEYHDIIYDLYNDSCNQFLGGHWSGHIRVCFLGASGKDLFRRTHDAWESEQGYFSPLLKIIVNGFYPSSLLLSNDLRRGALGKAFKDIIDSNLLRNQLQDDYYSDEASLSFQPLALFQLNDGGRGHFSFEKIMQESGLRYYFEKEFPWNYKINKDFESNVEDLDERAVQFYFGKRLDLVKFNRLLQAFMNGHKVFLDTANMNHLISKRLELFFTENSLRLEKVNYISPVTKVSLGEGLLITYDSHKLKETSLIKRSGFWDAMIGYLNLKHLKVKAEDGIHYFWKVRSSNTYELNYEEIRRVNFYNPTSYKKKAHVHTSSNFAFVKIIDQYNSQVNSTPLGIDMELKPGAFVTLDFGYFE